MVSKASEDLPEPERPVKTTSLSRGISTSMFFRLCSRAPRMVMARSELGPDWRRAFRISSISAIPGARDARIVGRASLLQPRSDANWSDARNVGRTVRNFQCRVQLIPGFHGDSARNGGIRQQ